MATSLTVTFDGVNSVDRLVGQTAVDWFAAPGLGFMGYYSVFNSVANDFLTANVSLTGTNWRVKTMRFNADFDNKTILQDLNGNSGRNIDFLELGKNSDVDLISTRVKFIAGLGGGAEHDVTLGSASTDSVVLDAAMNILTTGSGFVTSIATWSGQGNITINSGGAGDYQASNANDTLTVKGGTLGSANLRKGTDTVVVDGGGRINSLKLRDGDDTVTVKNGSRIEFLNAYEANHSITIQDGSRIQSLFAGEGNITIDVKDTSRITMLKLDKGTHTVTTADKFLESLSIYEASTTLNIGNGGAGQISAFSDNQQTHNIDAKGEIGSLQIYDTGSDPNDDQTTTLKLGDGGAGYVRLGHGNDKVTTGVGDVVHVSTKGGNDLVNSGSGGIGIIQTGDGNDTVIVRQQGDGNETILQGGGGIDVLNLFNIGKAVTFSLDKNGVFQNVGGPGGALNKPGVGLFSEAGFENVIGTKFADKLTGDAAANKLFGRGGNDTMFGGKANDLLNGENGFDKLHGGDGNDTQNGGLGNDTLFGNNGADKLFGQAGADNLHGGNGNDIVNGGTGNDQMRGNGGRDTFVFVKNGGLDKVFDYQDNFDTLRLVGHTGGFGDLTISNVNGNRKVVYDGGTIILVGDAGVQLTPSDFEFV